MRLVIFGPGGFGREILHAAMQDDRTVVFAADEPMEPVLGVPVIRPDEIGADDEIVFAIGDSVVRRELADRHRVASAGSVIARTALIGPDVQLGEGAVLCDYTIVTASAKIGRHFQCNIYSYVAHDCVIGDFVTFGPRVCCNGNVHIEDDCYVGTGAVIRNGALGKPIVIGRGATIGMGAVVTRSVPPGVTVVGNPAKALEMQRPS